jgi:GIY-YIG catalytic domain-containing protein/NUMOD3 motif-containing protein
MGYNNFNPMRTTFIYALCDPDTGDIRYIGKSDRPEERFKVHLRDLRHANHRVNWIKNLLTSGKSPRLQIIDEVPAEHWQQLEIAYIEFFKGCGYLLVNGTSGGNGMHNPTSQVRAKLSKALTGIKRPKQSQERIRNRVSKITGQKRSPEFRARLSLLYSGSGNPMFGKKQSIATIKKRITKTTGLKRSPEQRSRMSAAARNRKQPTRI